ncbi:MAG: galactose-1-phosphate uridylyltransferase [Pirellulales bacterium]
MTELRHDPITGASVIIAENRAGRPQEFEPVQYAQKKADCPFCEGAEAETPAEVFARRAVDSRPDAAGWQVRVVPNKYPALLREIDGTAGGDAVVDSLFPAQPIAGVHEVIVETPEHLERTSEFTVAALSEVIRVCRDRLTALRATGQLQYATVFKNVGPKAGATIRHAHSQLMAVPFVPSQPRTIMKHMAQYWESSDECLFCAVTQRESQQNLRIVAQTKSLVAFCPFAPRVAYETWIVPRSHDCKFDEISDERVEEAAVLLKRVMSRIDDTLNKPDYNYILNLAPFDSAELQNYHWHVVILPRLTTLAGFEWGSGCTINPVAPETAAGRLRVGGLLSQ